MTDRTSRVIGYGMLTFLSVILAFPFAEAMSTVPAGTLGDAFGQILWNAYPILIIWLIYKTIASML